MNEAKNCYNGIFLYPMLVFYNDVILPCLIVPGGRGWWVKGHSKRAFMDDLVITKPGSLKINNELCG